MHNMFCRVGGFRCNIMEQSDNRLRIYTWANHNNFPVKLKCIDRGVYEAWIDISDVECIWREEGYDYDKDITVLQGELKVKKGSVPVLTSHWDTKYCQYGGFAIHRGKKYRSRAGINNDFLFVLVSFDIESQEDGFIMETPGTFVKRVPTEKIEYAYEAKTWCIYKGLKLIAVEGIGDQMVLETYSRNDYPDKILEDLGFFIKNTKRTKVVNADNPDVKCIWVEKKPHYNFKDINFEPEILKGSV